MKLCDIVRVSTIEIANFELFASTPESFQVFTSERCVVPIVRHGNEISA